MIKHHMTIINLWGRGERSKPSHSFSFGGWFFIIGPPPKTKTQTPQHEAFSCISIKIATFNIPFQDFCKWSLKRIPLLSKAPNLDTHFSSMNFSMMPNTSPRILEHSTFITMLTSKSLPYINLKRKHDFN